MAFSPGLFSALGLAVAAIGKIAHHSSQRAKQAWSEAASTLGMPYSPPSLFRQKTIDGPFQGNRLEIESLAPRGKYQKGATRFRVRYPQPLGLGLKVRRRPRLAGVAALLGAPDIATGDHDFDSRVRVTGSDTGRIREFLTPERRREILRLFDQFPGCTIEDSRLEWSRVGPVRKAGDIVDSALALSSGATHLCLDTKPAAAPVEPAPAENPELGAASDPIAEPGPAATEAAPEPPPAIEPRPAATDAGAVAAGPAPAEVCEELFAPGSMSVGATRRFEKLYQGRRVRWSGELVRASAYRIDITFPDGPGTKATFRLPLPGGPAARPVQAVVQLPPEAAGELRTRIGQVVAFEGRLAGCDALLRSFRIADARLV
jgi:hypothetical protein